MNVKKLFFSKTLTIVLVLAMALGIISVLTPTVSASSLSYIESVVETGNNQDYRYLDITFFIDEQDIPSNLIIYGNPRNSYDCQTQVYGYDNSNTLQISANATGSGSIGGTVTISGIMLASAPGGNYRFVLGYIPTGGAFTQLAEAVFNINTARVNFDTDRWNFENQVTPIPLDFYTRLYGPVDGTLLYREDITTHGTGGQCYGMAATTATINDKMLSVSTFGQPYLSNVGLNDSSMAIGMTAADFIKYGFALQYSRDISQQRKNTTNDLQDLYKAVIDFQSGSGDPVVLDIYGTLSSAGNCGHTIYPLRVGYETTAVCEIIVNDSNSPDKERILTLTKNNDSFTGWSYDLYYYDAYVTTWGSGLPNSKFLIQLQLSYYPM